jgi:hypothetical protein
MKIHLQPIAVIVAIILMLSILPVAGVGIVSNRTDNLETFSPASQYSLLINPVSNAQTGQPLEITGITDAPEGSSILITGMSVYYRMHRHQKGSDLSHDTFVFEGKTRNMTGGKRGFSAIINNTSTLRPDDYFIDLFTNGQSHNETMIRLRPGQSQLRTDLILDPPGSSYVIGESIPVSGQVSIPEARWVYAQIIPNTEQQNASHDSREVLLIVDFPLKENSISGYRIFEGSTSTTGLYPGNYTLQVAAFDEQNGSWFAVNRTRIMVTGSPASGTQQKAGDPFAISLLLFMTAVSIATWQHRRLR